ncbi:MAG: putative dethiobiotin synthetase [Leptospirillum sp. Group IV 'UBA BS']|nr:MAG: putative dethiobiotin synthetase [Leptospirillum sp. Group IV 'UBA BS']
MSRKGSSTRFAPLWDDSLIPSEGVLFVMGTDTGVGKTKLVESLIRSAPARARLRIVKAAQTGVGEPGEERDLDRYLRAGASHDEVWEGYSFARPLDPMTAARFEGRSVDPDYLLKRIRAFHDEGYRVIVEGSGGILSPFFSDGSGILSIASRLDRPLSVLLVSHPHLGTLSTTLAAVRILGEEGLSPRLLVLCTRPGVRDKASEVNPGDPQNPSLPF